jgi:hypothetical protein
MSSGGGASLDSNAKLVLSASRIERSAHRLVRFSDAGIGAMIRREAWFIFRQSFYILSRSILRLYKKEE